VATYARRHELVNNHFTANLPRNLSVKKVVNRLRFDRIMAMSLWPYFFGPPCPNSEILSKLLLFRHSTEKLKEIIRAPGS